MSAARFRALRVNPTRVDIAAATREVDQYVWDFVEDILESVNKYPPPPPNSTYVRRGLDGGIMGSWHHSIINVTNGVEHRLYNNATDPRGRQYFIYVQGAWQTALHAQTGWDRLDLAVLAKRREYRNGLQAIYRKHLRRQA